MTEATVAATTATTATTAATTSTETAAATTAATTATTATATDFDWSKHGFEGEELGYIQNKGFKNAKDAVTGYRNLESLLGADKNTIIKVPKEQTPEAMREVYAKLGMPEKPEGYQIPVPEGQSDILAKAASGWFHEAGLSTKQAGHVVVKMNEFTAAQEQAMKDVEAARGVEAQTALKAEWGAAYTQNEALVEKAAQTFGMKPEQLLALREAMGPADAMKFLHNIGAKLGAEDKHPGGQDNQGFAMTPAAAKEKLAALKADPEWTKKFLNNDVGAMAESEKLHKFAYPDTQNAG